MFNEGRWNSDLAIFYVLVFFSPMMLYFLAGFLIRISQFCEKREKIVYIEKPVYKEVIKYVERPAKTNVEPIQTKPSQRPRSIQKPIQQEARVNTVKEQNTTVDSVMFEDAILALVGTGFKKQQAKKIVSDLLQYKRYTNVADIIKDAFTKK